MRQRHFTRSISLFLLLLLLLGLHSVAAVQASGRVLRVGVPDFGYYSKDAQGESYGYGFAYLEELSRYADYRYEFVEADWDDCLEMLARGEIDLLDSAQWTTERNARYLFTQYSTGKSHATLNVRADQSQAALSDPLAMDGLCIGLLRDNTHNHDLARYAKKLGFSYTTKDFGNLTEMKAALQAGTVDAILSNNLCPSENEQVIARLNPRPFYIMLAAGETALQQELIAALEHLSIYKPDLQSKLETQYSVNPSKPVFLTQEERDFIQMQDSIRIVFDSYWPPFESYNAAQDLPEGLNVDFFHNIADATGLRFSFLPGYDYESALQMVASGEVDMLLSYDTNPEKAQQLGIQLSDTFLETPIAIIGRDYAISNDSTFAISDMHPLIYDYIRERFPDSTILRFPAIEDCYRAVKNKAADFTAENIYAATYAIKDGYWGDLRISTVTTLTDKFSFAFTGDIDHRLFDIFNKYIAALSVQEKDQLLLTHSANLASMHGAQPFVQRYSTQIFIGATVLLILTAISLALIVLQQKRNRRTLWNLAYTDPLTGLPNTNQLKIELETLLHQRPQDHFLLLQMDINKFTLINDLYGFTEGDQVLCAVQDALHRGENEPHLSARMYGDIFLVLISCPNPESLEEVYHTYEKHFLADLSERLSHKLHFAVGRYLIEPGERDVALMLERVNYAHNTAKRLNWLNKPYDYDDGVKQQAIRHREIESRMEDALKQGAFSLYLQPKYGILENRLMGAEVLVRWPNFSEGEMLSPIEFIPLFEKNGFITQLDFYMFRRSCELLRTWMQEGCELTSLAVNFSRLHLQNPNFVHNLREIAQELDIPPAYLEIELTESAAMGSEEQLLSVIDQLHEAGFRFAMDDFGTGYSSLGLLKSLPVDTLKIDRSFFDGSQDDPRARIVLENIFHMAKQLQIHTVAEGVETFEQVSLLHEIGCETIQGYYFSFPMPAEQFSTDWTPTSRLPR